MFRVVVSFLLNVWYKKKERKKERKVLFLLLVRFNEFCYFLFYDLWINTVDTILKLQTTQGRYDAGIFNLIRHEQNYLQVKL